MSVQKENRFLFCTWLCLFLLLLFLRLNETDAGAPADGKGSLSGGTDSLLTGETGTEEPDIGQSEKREGQQVIRVLLTDSSQSGYYHSEAVLTPAGRVRVSGTDLWLAPGETVTFTADDQRFSEGKITLEPEDPGAGIALNSVSRGGKTPVYEGSLEIYQTEHGLYLVNAVELETYLKYVVPSEMPASYETEALKAQAVCARTYACRAMEENALAQYHAQVDDSVSFQVYNGIGRQPATDQAVDETRGQIMTWGGEPITAYFFSTSCGYTSTSEVWGQGNSEEYLKSVYLGSDAPENVQTEEVFASFIAQKDPDDFEAEDSWYRWKATLPAAVLDSRLEPYGIGTLQEMTVRRRSSGGAVTELLLTGSSGSAVLENEYDIREFLSVKGIPVTKNDGTSTTEMGLLPSAYFICSSVYEGSLLTGFEILGGGYGHGVGMSQNGARHLAQQGYSWQEILRYFYKDITLEQDENIRQTA